MFPRLALIIAMTFVGGWRISAQEPWVAPVSREEGDVVMRVVMVQDEDGDPLAAGKAAAESLRKAMGGVALKAVIVSVSWVLAYFAMKHLPISLFSPIRASGPAWTLLGAVLFFHERPLPMQWAGIAVIFCSYYAFSVIGQKEGVVFHRSRWILYIFLATLIGSISTLYDKYLIQQLGYTPMLVQFWFAFYNVALLGPFTVCVWLPKRKQYTPFEWRWSVPAIGLLLIAADFVYFNAVKNHDALIVILSLLRRSSVVVSFAVGAFIFGDVNRRGKAWALAGVLAGVILIVLA